MPAGLVTVLKRLLGVAQIRYWQRLQSQCCGNMQRDPVRRGRALPLQVGIMHTNYLDYARREEGGETKAKLLEAYNNWVCRVHCHKARARTRRRCRRPRFSVCRTPDAWYPVHRGYSLP